MRVSRAVASAAAAGLLSGCSITAGSISPFASTAPTPVALPAAPPTVAYGSFLDGPVGARLSQASRDKALAAEQDALASGQRKTWKGDGGTFGYVEPASGGAATKPATEAADASAPAMPDQCRAFTSTVFIGGRPQVGHGSGCQNPDGSYRITG